jgi:hypothetical protein
MSYQGWNEFRGRVSLNRQLASLDCAAGLVCLDGKCVAAPVDDRKVVQPERWFVQSRELGGFRSRELSPSRTSGIRFSCRAHVVPSESVRYLPPDVALKLSIDNRIVRQIGTVLATLVSCGDEMGKLLQGKRRTCAYLSHMWHESCKWDWRPSGNLTGTLS